MPCPRWTTGILIVAAVAAAIASSRAYAIDAATIAAAKREGEVTWYSTQIINQLVRPVAAAFEKKYPGIRVRYIRANATEIAIKILNESHAGNPQSDIFDGTSTVVPLEREGYVLQWLPEPAKSYPALYRDPEGYWVASHIFINTPGYNTALIPKGSEPKTYQDLLDPKWRGKIVWDGLPSASGGTGFIGTVLAEMGEQKGMDYLRAFAKQKVVNVAASAREVLDQVIAGEYPLALQIFNHHAVISAKKGAPVDWIKLEPATGTLSTVSIHKNAPHPNAAKLLFDFIISDEGQKVFRDADYLTADPAVPPREPSLTPEGGHFRTRFFSPEALEDNTAKWTQVFEQLFR
jgi:ABC-type Fe3+ transport system substrate-binding protein